MKLFPAFPAKAPCLKYLVILFCLCFVAAYLKNFLKRSFVSYIEHNRVKEIITYFQTARRQGNNNLFLAVSFLFLFFSLWMKKLNDLSQSHATMSIVKSYLFCMLWNWRNYQNSKQPETIWNYPQPTETTQKPPKTTCTNGTPQSLHRAASHWILPCFYAVEFEHDLIIKRVKLGKNGKN